MASSSFQIDSLIHHLKELQNEKSGLEKKLGDLRSKHRELENTNDAVNQKHLYVTENHHRMEETLKVAQLKVSRTQSLADCLEHSNSELRAMVSGLEAAIETEKVNHDENIKKFEESLATIADKLNRAKQFYSDTNLEKELTAAGDIEVNLQAELDSQNREIDEMAETMSSLGVAKDELTAADSLSEDERVAIWLMVTDYNKALSNRLTSVQASLADQRGQEQQLTTHINELTAS